MAEVHHTEVVVAPCPAPAASQPSTPGRAGTATATATLLPPARSVSASSLLILKPSLRLCHALKG